MKILKYLPSLLLACSAFTATVADAQRIAPHWIPIPQEAKPYTRWWWLGSAVDSLGLKHNLTEYAKAGIGGVEITPIYGVQGNDANDIPYLSTRWMDMLSYTEALGRELGIETDMATGTGWPFGGPLVPESEAASKAIVANGTISVGRTGQKVKRAAPGGEGFVIDHFDHDAVAHYLQRFDDAFKGRKFPRTFFNDSYEVYGADWTPRLLSEFEQRRGYRLQDHYDLFLMPDSLRTDEARRIMSDYRQTMGELLLQNFTNQWTSWAHSHGAITRNQAHGSPANLIDVYAAVDIPECEGFGLSDFGIKGLRTDAGFTKKNFSDISMLKYASSASHISGKPFTSSETFTWLTEHFRTSLSQCKPDLDLMFLSGVNHVFFHGSCYSPADAEWPGWRFYASVDMSPNNNWWSAMPAFSQYIQRSQAFLQHGEPDNDILVYLPFYDMIYDQPDRIALFDIHSMERRAPKFIESIQNIIRSGYDCDYISDQYLMKSDVVGKNHNITTTGRNAYAAILVPDVRFMPLASLRHLYEMARQGASVIFVGGLPESIPGYNVSAKDAKEYAKLLKALRPLAKSDISQCKADIEPMRKIEGLSCIRRADVNGHYYFISNLQGVDVDSWVRLGKACKEAILYNPMNGSVTRARLRHNDGGHPEVLLQLASGESVILVTTIEGSNVDELADQRYYDYASAPQSQPVLNWTLTFPKAEPVAISKSWKMEHLTSWTELGDTLLAQTMATGRYTTTLRLDAPADKDHAYVLDLGDVRETAHVTINGKSVAQLFAVPYRLDVSDYLTSGDNTIQIDVCNLPANRIAQMDRQGIEWRKFKEINVVDLNYKRDRYSDWAPVPSGLCSDVTLQKIKLIK